MVGCTDCKSLSDRVYHVGILCDKCGSNRTYYHPTEEQIARECLRIQKGWSPVEFARRRYGLVTNVPRIEVTVAKVKGIRSKSGSYIVEVE